MTDEGRRYLKISNIPVEWCNLEHMPLIHLHPSTNISLPLISQPCRFRRAVKSASFPSGEAKGGCRQLSPFTQPLCYITLRADSIRPYKITLIKNFQPSTFPVPICAYWLPLVRGEPIGFESGITCSRGLRRPEPCRLRCRCTSRSSW